MKHSPNSDSDVAFDSIVELARVRAAYSPSAHGYLFTGVNKGNTAILSYADLDKRARSIAAHLQARWPAGERALLLYPPGLDYICAFFGCLYAGIVAVPAYPVQSPRELARLDVIVADAGASIICTLSAHEGAIQAWLAMSGRSANVTCLATDTIPEAVAHDWKDPQVSANTLAFLQYTSGSTGDPKGVMVSHGNLLHNLQQSAHRLDLTADTRGVAWLPP
jgi:acyl-CoA synthetase (AMP-forming)/AMP-acid ligase II